MYLLSEPPPSTLGGATLPTCPEKAKTLEDGGEDDDSMIDVESEPVGSVVAGDENLERKSAVAKKEGESKASAGGEVEKEEATKVSSIQPTSDKKPPSSPTTMGAVKKATTGAIGDVKWALGKQRLACARLKPRPPLPVCLPADLYSSNLTRYDVESHRHRPNVRHPSQQPQSTDCLLDVVRSFSQIRLDFGRLRKLDRCSKAHGVFRSICCRLGCLYSTCSGY
jgi:hypothetical protein